MNARTCGTCTMCCKIMGVPDLVPPKQGHVWCPHCAIGKGCKIYETRPPSCREFSCLWLMDKEGVFSDADRPDKTHVVLHQVGNGVIAHCEASRPTEWRKLLRYLRWLARSGRPVSAWAGRRFWIITGKTEWEVPAEHVYWTPAGPPVVTVPDDVKKAIGLYVKPEFYPPGMQ